MAYFSLNPPFSSRCPPPDVGLLRKQHYKKTDQLSRIFYFLPLLVVYTGLLHCVTFERHIEAFLVEKRPTLIHNQKQTSHLISAKNFKKCCDGPKTADVRFISFDMKVQISEPFKVSFYYCDEYQPSGGKPNMSVLRNPRCHISNSYLFHFGEI